MIDASKLDQLDEKARGEVEALLAAREELLRENPLEGFHACERFCGSPECPPPSERNPSGGRPKQHEFMAAPEELVATNAGNRFGKTTAMVVFSIIQHCPVELVPERLKVFKRERGKKVKHRPVLGRYMLPSEDALENTILPEFKRWCPPSILKGGSWEKAYRAQHNTITFKEGLGKLSFYTYKQDPAVLAGASLDYILWDEPPGEGHWRESAIRTLDRQGCHRFGLTPVNMQGGGIGWIKREIWDRAKPDHPEHDPNIRIVRGSIHDNPDLTPEEIERHLARYPADERQAREFGDFIHFGGMIYPGGFEQVLRPAPTPQEVGRMDVVVGIDPGLKNAAFVWGAFDNDNRLLVFDELLIQEGTPLDYAAGIREINTKWQLREEPVYVIDPSARNRSLINMESVQGELERQGIFPMAGQNQVQAGVQQIRRRMAEQGFFVSVDCTGLRAEADEYRMEDRPDGEFKVVKENDHRLDAARYLAMSRPWYQNFVETPQNTPWTPGTAPSFEWLHGATHEFTLD